MHEAPDTSPVRAQENTGRVGGHAGMRSDRKPAPLGGGPLRCGCGSQVHGFDNGLRLERDSWGSGRARGTRPVRRQRLKPSGRRPESRRRRRRVADPSFGPRPPNVRHVRLRRPDAPPAKRAALTKNRNFSQPVGYTSSRSAGRSARGPAVDRGAPPIPHADERAPLMLPGRSTP